METFNRHGRFSDRHTDEEWFHLVESHKWRCFWCGQIVTIHTVEKDHLQPRSRGGSDRIDNIVPCCRSCNCKKGNMNAEEYWEQLTEKSRKRGKFPTSISLLEKEERAQFINLEGQDPIRREEVYTSWAWRNPPPEPERKKDD